MRLATVNCILLACLATAVAAGEPRPKRDILYLKNFLTSKLFGSTQDTSSDSTPELIRQDGNIKIFRIPGFDKILVKAIPKTQVETIQTQEDIKVIEHPTIAILKSYLGTKTQGETLSALQGIKNLLNSGILNAQHDLVEILPVKEPCLPKPVADIPEPSKVSLIPALPPTIVSVEPVNQLHTPYSYKQMHLDGNITTYISQDGHDVIVTETHKPMPPPPAFILDRLQQVIVLGMKPVQAIASVVPKPVFHVPLRPVVSPVPAIVQAPKADVKVNSYSYRQHDHDGGVTTYFGSGHTGYSPVVVEKQAFVRPPYIETIEASALSTNLPKAPSGYRFKIVNNANINNNVARRVFYNSPRYYQSPEQMYVYKQMTPSQTFVENTPRFDTKGEVHVNVNRAHFNKYDLPPFLSTKINSASGGFLYNQHHHDGTVTSYSGDKSGSSSIKETVKIIPAIHIHNDDRIENAANAHEAPSPKLWSGYSFKIGNNGVYMNNMASNQDTTGEKQHNIGTGAQGTSGFGAYSYKVVNNDDSNTDVTIDARKEGNSIAQTEKASSRYSFKIVNNQAFVNSNSGKVKSNIGATNNGGSYSSSDVYSYKQANNDGSLSTYSGTGEADNGNSVVLVGESNTPNPTPPVYITDTIENVTAKTHSAEKTSSGYSFKLVNGNVADQTRQHIGMTSLNATSNANGAGSGLYSYKKVSSSGASTTYVATGDGKDGHSDVLVAEVNKVMPARPAYIFDRMENTGSLTHTANKGPSKYSFKIVNNHAFVSSNGKNTIDQEHIGAGTLKIKNGENVANNDGSSSNSSAYSYKFVNNAGTSTTYVATGARTDGKSDVLLEKSMNPIPATYIIDRMENVATQAHALENTPSGYSFKIVNNQANKIDGNQQNSEISNGGSSSSSGAYSYKLVNNAGTSTTYVATGAKMDGKSDVLVEESMKPIPAPTTYIIDRIENVATQAHASENTPSGYSFKIVNNQANKVDGIQQNSGKASIHLSSATTTDVNKGSLGLYSYKQGYKTGTLNTTAATDTVNEDIDGKSAPSSSGYSFRLVNNQVFSSNAAGQHNIASAPNGEKHGESSPGSGGYSYTQIDNAGTTTTYVGADEDTKRKVSEFNKGVLFAATTEASTQTQSGYSFNIANNIQGVNGHSERKGEKHQAVMFTEPVTSRYIYKQIITNNPQPFTVVRVEDKLKPTFESNADLTVKVNTHMHINPDGTRYLCDDRRHMREPDFLVNDQYENVPEVQNKFVYVPPAISEDTMIEKEDEESDSTDSLSENPIVVAPIDHIYSFKQTKTDGSSFNVESSSQDTVSVSLNEGESTESHRGDIP